MWPPPAAAPLQLLKPGQVDAQRFKQHYSVEYWQTFGTRMSTLMGDYKNDPDSSG